MSTVTSCACPLRIFQISAAASPVAATLTCAAAATRNEDGNCGSSPVSVSASSAEASPPAEVQISRRISWGLFMGVLHQRVSNVARMSVRNPGSVLTVIAQRMRSYDPVAFAPVIARAAKQSYAARRDGLLRCARNDGWIRASRSRGAMRPRFASSFALSKTEGAGKTGCALHPRSRVQLRTAERAHEHTGSAETLRPSLRNGFTAYFVLSPVNGSLATVAPEKLRFSRT